ncbi:MAG TPA: DUF2523 domain-containing protein [Xylella sp.]
MLNWFAIFFRALFGHAVARVLVGAGLALVTTASLVPLVTSALNLVVSNMSGIPADLLNVVLLMGFGQALSIIGSAILTRLALQALYVSVVKSVSGASGV